MKLFRPLLYLVLVFALTATVFGQKSKTSSKKPVAQPVAAASVLELRDGADKVSVQIKNVTKFLYMLGGIAYGMEDLDAQAKTKTLPKSTVDANTANKAKVMLAIRNLRAGIATLEVEFRTKPALKKYLPQIDGITQISAECEDLAAAGRFSDSGQPLLLLVEKLSDTLAAM